MRLTKKKAIELSVELWTWLAETGKEKLDWPGWEQYEDITSECFLCEYADRHSGCDDCSYRQKFCYCCEGDSPYSLWHLFQAARTKKKYARLFLEQLKQL